METTYFRRAVRSTFRPSNHITILPFLVNVLDMPRATKKQNYKKQNKHIKKKKLI